MSERIEIDKFSDLLKVPLEHRESCALDLVAAMNRLELEVGNEAARKYEKTHQFWWEDDGDDSITLEIVVLRGET